MKVWDLRVFERRKPGQRKDPSYVTVAHGPGEVAQAITNVLTHDNVTRVDITPQGYKPEAPKPKPVKAQKIEWQLREHPRGDLWVGYVGGRMVADVFAPSQEGRKPYYSLFLGGGDDERLVDCSNVEAAKRTAQRALNKVVQALVGG